MVLDINSNRIDANFLDDNGIILDYFTITKGSGPGSIVAGFSGSPRSGNAPLNVSFTDQSIGVITSYSWDFGDGGTSSAQNPSHTYTAQGTYTVSLTVTGPSGSDTETKSNYITVTTPGSTVTVSFQDGVSGYSGTRDTWLNSQSPSTNVGGDLELELDGTAFGMGTRAQRFAMIVDDGTATHVAVEAPGQLEVSKAESVLSNL